MDAIFSRVEKIIELVRSWDGYKTYADLVEKNYDNYISTLASIYKPTWTSSYQVLIHGDFHTKNILIRGEGTNSQIFTLSVL